MNAFQPENVASAEVKITQEDIHRHWIHCFKSVNTPEGGQIYLNYFKSGNTPEAEGGQIYLNCFKSGNTPEGGQIYLNCFKSGNTPASGVLPD